MTFGAVHGPVLDLGCGTGTLTKMIKSAHQHGLPARPSVRHGLAMWIRWLTTLPAMLAYSSLVGCGDGASPPGGTPPSDAASAHDLVPLNDVPSPDALLPDIAQADAPVAPSNGCAPLGAGCDGGVGLPGLTEMRFSVAIGSNHGTHPRLARVKCSGRSSSG